MWCGNDSSKKDNWAWGLSGARGHGRSQDFLWGALFPQKVNNNNNNNTSAFRLLLTLLLTLGIFT